MPLRNIAILIGTRPEAIKLMPVIHAIRRANVQTKVFVTGQHRELLTPILTELKIDVTENMGLMRENQSLTDLSARVLEKTRDVLQRHRPDLLIVQGDTTSVAMSALACFYEDIPVAHVEAGLRTYSKRNPFPEEVNRRIVSCVADIHFAPTAQARDNLIKEGVDHERIHLVGNTVVDALFYARDHLIGELEPAPEIKRALRNGRDIILVTGHRRESFGADLTSICQGIRDIAETFADRVDIVYPVHLNPNVRSKVMPLLASTPNVRLIDPLTYLHFVKMILRAKIVITDSGGVQEEAASLGIPVLVTRRTCERLEAVEAGISQLVGPFHDKIFEAASELLTNDKAYEERARPAAVFGDGNAAERMVEILLKYKH